MDPNLSTSSTMPSATPSPLPSKQYTKTHPLPPYNILQPTPSNIEQAISIIGTAFTETPMFLAFVTEVDSIPPTATPSVVTQSRRMEYYGPGITRVLTSGGLLVESGDFSAVAIWEPPSFSAPDFSSARAHWTPLSREWTTKMKRARLTYLGVEDEGVNPRAEDVTERTEIKLRPFWHLGFLARNYQEGASRVSGAVSAVVMPFLERAKVEGLPAWLEATTIEGVRMYEFFGFRVVKTVTLGAGVYGEHGWFEEGGKGCSAFCMIYDAHLR